MRDFGQALARFSAAHAKAVTAVMVLSTFALLALGAIPTLAPDSVPFLNPLQIDTDPENMLAEDEEVRVEHRATKARFGISDAVVLGIVNTSHPDGPFNVETLARVHALTEHAKGLEEVVQVDLLSLSTVDRIESTGPSSLSFDWLMKDPPKTEEEARAIRDRAMRIPMLVDAVVSQDGKAVAIYLPLVNKHDAHDVMVAMNEKIDELGPAEGDEYHFAGLPVAEDTFGIEMFIQMAISAPAAMAVIFLLMWFFFRRLTVITAPMIVAMVSAMSTMGLLVVTGNTVHIMSSMIPIFIMPIAVLDAIHIISDFFDRYAETGDRNATMEHVLGDLFAPLLFTSLTTAVGFASLALTPIPPVQVFGIFVAFGVLSAFLWTVMFIPAYVSLLSEKRLEGFGRTTTAESDDADGLFGRLAGAFTVGRSVAILVVSVGLAGLAVYGIQKIEINDNPVRWFEEEHPLRIADTTLNKHFGGTYDAFLRIESAGGDGYSATSYAALLRSRAEAEASHVKAGLDSFAATIPGRQAGDAFAYFDAVEADARAAKKSAPEADTAIHVALAGFLDEQLAVAEEADPSVFDAAAHGTAMKAALETYRDEVSASYAALITTIAEIETTAPDTEDAFLAGLAIESRASADAPAKAFVGGAAQLDETFKDPAVLAWLDEFETAVRGMDTVGKTTSIVDVVKTVHRDLFTGETEDFRIPDKRASVAQTLDQFTSSHRKDDLWHFVTPDYRGAAIWLFLDSGDNKDMEKLVADVDAWLAENPPPAGIEEPVWSGLTYVNVVWQQKMVSGMSNALLGSFVVVLIMMVFLFRSPLWGVMSMIPLTLTVGLIYGILGLVGKDYDMPVAVLSSLSLGLAIDYAIHFLARSRELQRRHGTWEKARQAVFAEPARAIGRNIIVVGLGFLPLLLAPLVPYQTVGILIASILLLAGFATLVLLPALITVGERFLFRTSD